MYRSCNDDLIKTNIALLIKIKINVISKKSNFFKKWIHTIFHLLIY